MERVKWGIKNTISAKPTKVSFLISECGLCSSDPLCGWCGSS